MSEKCRKNKHNNNSDNPFASRRTDGGNNNKHKNNNSDNPLTSHRTNGDKTYVRCLSVCMVKG